MAVKVKDNIKVINKKLMLFDKDRKVRMRSEFNIFKEKGIIFIERVKSIKRDESVIFIFSITDTNDIISVLNERE